jgi:PIN domain nuclease of toxin-antitoxin system
MARKYVVDTHALIWYLEGNPKLEAAAQTVMDDPASESALINDVTSDSRIELYPLTFEVLQQSLTAGTVPEMHDRLIVATTLYLQNLGHQVSLLSIDSQIIGSALVSIIW